MTFVGHFARLIFIAILLTVLSLGCASQSSGQDAEETPPPERSMEPEKSPPAPAETKPLAPYPVARRSDDVDIINGYEVRDPYRWMEQKDAADAWITSENRYTEKYLSKFSFPNLQERVTELFSIGFVGQPRLQGERLFYVKREGEKVEQAVLYMKEGEQDFMLVDPNLMDREGKTTIDWYYPSPDGKLLAYGISKDGSENSTLYVLNLETRESLDLQIPDTRHCSLAWLPDASGFFYTRYPAGERYNRKAYFHKLGDDPAKDALIFGDKKRDKSDWTTLELNESGRHLLIAEYRGHENTDLYHYDTQSKRLTPILVDKNIYLLAFEMHKDTIYAATNTDAPNARIVRFSLNAAAPSQWKTIVPEGQWPIESFQFAGDRLLVSRLENVANKITVHGPKGKQLGEIVLPAIGMVSDTDVDKKTGRYAFVFTSFFHPSALYVGNALTGDFVATKAVDVKHDISADAYMIKQVQYPSYDGTMVNMFIVHRKNAELDGQNQCLLYGYGGFQINMAPYFSRRVMFWIERGGIYAVANIRGGGEYGEKWHEAGVRENKFQVFNDFEYAMRYLIRNKYSNPERLIIEGGSNGGLLVGAMMTRTPHLFAGALGSVGLYDMIRYHRFPPGELWVPEYGNADEKTDTGFLFGYSPYHQVLSGVEYPAFFGETAESDTRVHWVHTAKFVAALQYANTSHNPTLFYLERRAGHGAGKGMSDVVREYINKFTFMFSIVGDPLDK